VWVLPSYPELTGANGSHLTTGVTYGVQHGIVWWVVARVVVDAWVAVHSRGRDGLCRGTPGSSARGAGVAAPGLALCGWVARACADGLMRSHWPHRRTHTSRLAPWHGAHLELVGARPPPLRGQRVCTTLTAVRCLWPRVCMAWCSVRAVRVLLSGAFVAGASGYILECRRG